MHQQQNDYAEVYGALSAFVSPGQTFEVRLLHHNRKRTDAGYFDNPGEAAALIAGLQENYAGIYFTPNPVEPSLAARAYNRIDPWAVSTTMDAHILRRRWLLIDIDPERPSGISSTDVEYDNAYKVACTVANMLEFEGWPEPYINRSGNGAHILYPLDEPNNVDVRDTIQVFLKTLDARFKDDGCTIDKTTFNASRIFRIPGTWARKGDDIPVRPHRKAYRVSSPMFPVPVSLARIKQFNADNVRFIFQPNVSTYQAPTPVAPQPTPESDENKYRHLNKQAYDRVRDWVPRLFPTAREYKLGYRIKSEDLGLHFEEDLAIHPLPWGIKYFGVADQGEAAEGKRTPVAIVAEFLTDGDTFKASELLSSTLNVARSEFNILDFPAPQGLDSGGNLANLPGVTATAPQFDFRRVPSMADLQAKVFKEPTWIIPNVLPAGAILLAARPKMRKTFLALQLALAVVGGRRFLDWQATQGDVLFLGLEDNERRLKSRIKLLQTFDLSPAPLDGFRYWTGGVDISPTGREYISNPEEAARTYAAFPRGERGVEALEAFLDMYPRTKLVVIDTYAHFREQSNNRDVYQRDYDQMMPITRMCAKREICCIVVHHEKKGLAGNDSADFMEDVSGTTGITGAVDGVMSIKGRRGVQDTGEDRKLLLSGRDIPNDIEIDMRFDAERGGWLPHQRQDLKLAILQLLKLHRFMTQADVSASLPNVPRNRIVQVLTSMKFEHLVDHTRLGYSIPNDFKGD
jgi:hypothetical protein